MNIPTLLTVSRIVICPLFVVIYLYPSLFHLGLFEQIFSLIGLLAFILVTDALDGYLARRLSKVTNLGKLLDPMSDCIAFLSIFFSFTQKPIEIPLLVPIVLMVREIAVVYLRSLVALTREAMGARWSGKIKTIIQSVTAVVILILMLGYYSAFIELSVLQSASFSLMVLTMIASVASLLDYCVACRRIIYDSITS